MPNKSSNISLQKAKKAKKDEFYTQLSDIEKELSHYTEHFKRKTATRCLPTTTPDFRTSLAPKLR
ncbi:hypothetical protein J7L68_01845 [bacterium]|nr:hypothetical protein [bacterium]